MKALYLLILIFSIISCNRQEDEKNLGKKNELDSLSTYLISKVEKFSLLSSGGIPDSNELIFNYSQRFDTSFLVHFKKQKGEVRGVVYQVASPYYRDEGDFANEKDELMFFEGYSFKIDSIHWSAITREATRILTKKDDRGKGHGCFDCPYYILVFDSKVRNSYGSDEVLLPSFAAYLKDSLLNQCMAKKPKWQRSI